MRSAPGPRTKRLRNVVLAMALVTAGCVNKDSSLPRRYRDLKVPEAMLASAEVRARGRKIFLKNCAICHGERADGNGVRGEGLNPKPVDFTSPAWRDTATPRHTFYVIQTGVPGTAMPSWNTFSGKETWELVAYVLSVAERP